MGRHAVLVGLIAIVTALPQVLAPLNSYDGGLAASTGTFLLHGALPYRDTWWLYGPAAPLVAAGLSAVLGPSVLLLRIAGLVVVGVQAGASYALIRPRAPHVGAAILSIGVVAAASTFVGLDLTAWSLAMALALAGLALRVREPGRPLLAGILIGLAFAARFDVGGYALVASLLLGERRRFLAGFGGVAVPVGLALVAIVPFGDLVEQLVWFPLVGTRRFRSVPIPEVVNLISVVAFLATVVVPKLTVLGGAAVVAAERGRRGSLAVLVAFAALCQLQTLARADFYHQAQAAVPAVLVLGWLAGPSLVRIREPIPRLVAARRLAVVAVVAAVCSLMLDVAALAVPSAEQGTLGTGERDLVAGIRTLIANTTPDETVFVGLTDHRITLENDMLAYYLADRPSGVRVAMFNPGVTNTDIVQGEMAADLAGHRTSLLLLDELWSDVSEPSNESAILGSTVLDRSLAERFIEVCRFGAIHILATPDRAPTVRCVDPRPDERLIDILGGLERG